MNSSKNKITTDNLHKDLSLYRRIFANSTDCIAILNSEGEYIEQNIAHQKLLGLTDFDIIGETPSVIFGDISYKKIIAQLNDKGTYTGKVQAADSNGNELTTALSAFALRKNGLQPTNYVLILSNIAKAKISEEDLGSFERKYKQLIEKSLQAIIIIQDSKIVYSNKSFSRLSGYSVDKLLSSLI